MLPSNVMSFVKKMVTTEEVVGGGGAPGQVEPPGTFGKLRQTLSSSLLTAQDKVTKLSPRPGAAVATPPEPEPTPAPPPPTVVAPPAPSKQEREAGKPPSRAGACRVCLKALKPGDVYHTCRDCQHRVCEDCSSYSKPTNDEDASFWRCSVCRRKVAPRRPPAAQDSTDSLLDVPVLDALQRRHSEARLGGGGGGGGALAPPRSPELRRHSDVSPASLKELEKLKSGGKADGETSRRASGGGGGGVPVPASVGGGVSPARRRSVRVPRQRSCDEDKPEGKDGTGAGLATPAPMPRRASAYDVLASGGGAGGPGGGAAAAAGGSRRPSYRADADQSSADPVPQISGLSVDEDRPLRRRGSQLPDIAALQRGGLSALAGRVSADSESLAASAAAAAAARQLSVDGEAIKIVIHDVDDTVPRRVILTRDPQDKGHRSQYRANSLPRGFGMRVVGGKPDSSGRRQAVVVWTVPGGPADVAGLQQGDKVLEWGGVSLTGRSFEEVCSVLERGGDTVEVIVQTSPLSDLEHHAQQAAHTQPPQLLFEPESDKSPSSPTRRKLPKTPV